MSIVKIKFCQTYSLFFMDIQQQKEFDFLKTQSLLDGLSEDDLRLLQNWLVRENFKPNEVIIEENSEGTDLYLIKEGEVSVLKWDEEHFSQIPLGRLSTGEMFGEMSFMDNSPRSTTVKAIKPTIVYKFSKDALAKHSTAEIQSQIFENIAIANIHRLRHSNILYVKNAQGYQTLLQEKKSRGHFFIYESLLLAFSVLLSLFSKDLRNDLPWLIALIPSFLLIRSYQYSWSHFGLSLQKWKSQFFAACLCLILVVGGLQLIKDFLNASLSFRMPPLSELSFLALACFAQEFIGRGIFQTTIQDFLDDKNGYRSILITACFIFIFFLPFGWQTSLALFCISLPMGLLFNQQKSVLGIFLIHFVLRILGILPL